ncbi:MAG: AAA family ATPase [Gammaproteobacteria bacterium]|nr:AAA family ATPase [Gammaproteobacteria bacterium]
MQIPIGLFYTGYMKQLATLYHEFFGLHEQPFQLTPDHSFLYLSKVHSRAKAYMEYTIWNRDSFVVITGEIGSGKTTLIHSLLSNMDENVLVAKIHQTQLDELEFYQAILVEFGLEPFEAASKVELLSMLNKFLKEQSENDTQVVLIIDEAQNLTPRVLEEVRLMTGMETTKGKILNLILVGQPELKDIIDAPGMEQLNQRIRFRFHLSALSESETSEYIEHRLATAGYAEQEERLFAKSTIKLIHHYTGGIPRLINILCDTAMLSAFVEGKTKISLKMIEEVIMELQWKPYSERALHQQHPKEINDLEHQPAKVILQISGSDKTREFSLEQETISIGRFEDNDIRIDNRFISGHHSKIVTVQGQSYVVDMGSTNGTFVNGQRISKCRLKNKDNISLSVRTRLLDNGETVAFAHAKLQYINENPRSNTNNQVVHLNTQ